MDIHILKPGTVLKEREGKTNLQIYEMQSLASLLIYMPIRSVNYRSIEIIDTTELTPGYQPASTVVIFCHHKMHSETFDTVLRSIGMERDLHVILVSNDVRLPFVTSLTESELQTISENNKFDIITNANYDLPAYTEVVAPKGLKINSTISMPLHILAISRIQTYQPKTKLASFFCMYYEDYDTARQKALMNAKDQLGDDLDLYGNVPYSVGLVKAKDVVKTMQDYKFTPILLEPSYNYFGVVPNRFSEAISANCLPVLATNLTLLEEAWSPSFIESMSGLICKVEDLSELLESIDDTARQAYIHKLWRVIEIDYYTILNRLEVLLANTPNDRLASQIQ